MVKDEACRSVELILSDVDGVLTDGGIIYDNQGVEIKRFDIQDGLGIRLWQRAGFRFGFLTSRSSQSVRLRAAELGVELLRQGCDEKLPVAQQIVRDLGLTPGKVCYIGDDLPDLAVLRYVGWSVAVADAVAEVRAVAAMVTSRPGGHGAVRETIELILKKKGMWEDLVRRFTG
jgi:YrbI family 3-deoxy-D-manno-octulosonate 8-phosphate phosphatase